MATLNVYFFTKMYQYSTENQLHEKKELMKEIIQFIYNYCTDFTINLANLLNITYYDVNALIFCIIWPSFTISLIFIYLMKKRQLKKLIKD